MTRRGQNPLQIHHADQAVDRTRREYEQKLRELDRQSRKQTLLRDVELEDAKETPVAHGLGRRVSVFLSPPRGATTSGRVEEVRSATLDPRRFVVLKATGWGATITVDVKCEANDG